VVVIVHFLLNHNHVNVQFIVLEDVYNNAQKFMRLKVLDHLMNVTQNAHKNVFHYVLQEKCQIISVQVVPYKINKKAKIELNQIHFEIF